MAIKFPRLVRTSVSLGGGDENELNPQPFKFAVMQHIISDFVRTELDISSCDELSNEMMNLLASLMTFGFYSTTEQLADVINPLLQALENHRVANILKSDVDNQILTPRKSFELANMSVKSKSKKQISASIRASAEGVSVKRRVTPAQDKNNHESWFKSPVSFIKSLFGIANPSTDAAAKKSIEGSMRYDGPSVTSMHARGSAAVSGDRRSVLGAAIPAHTVNRVVGQ